MNRPLTNERMPEAPLRFKSRITYLYYLLTVVTGVVVLFVGSSLNFLVDVIATGFYLAVTALFYALTRDPRRSA